MGGGGVKGRPGCCWCVGGKYSTYGSVKAHLRPTRPLPPPHSPTHTCSVYANMPQSRPGITQSCSLCCLSSPPPDPPPGPHDSLTPAPPKSCIPSSLSYLVGCPAVPPHTLLSHQSPVPAPLPHLPAPLAPRHDVEQRPCVDDECLPTPRHLPSCTFLAFHSPLPHRPR
jgi:hypothetical protein